MLLLPIPLRKQTDVHTASAAYIRTYICINYEVVSA